MTKTINVLDRIQIILLALTIKIFKHLYKKIYLYKGLYDPSVLNESHIFYFRNGKRIIKKCSDIIDENSYPNVCEDYVLLVEKLRAGASLSRFGGGDFQL